MSEGESAITLGQLIEITLGGTPVSVRDGKGKTLVECEADELREELRAMSEGKESQIIGDADVVGPDSHVLSIRATNDLDWDKPQMDEFLLVITIGDK